MKRLGFSIGFCDDLRTTRFSSTAILYSDEAKILLLQIFIPIYFQNSDPPLLNLFAVAYDVLFGSCYHIHLQSNSMKISPLSTAQHSIPKSPTRLVQYHISSLTTPLIHR